MKRVTQSDFCFIRMALSSVWRIVSRARVGSRLFLLSALVIGKDDRG